MYSNNKSCKVCARILRSAKAKIQRDINQPKKNQLRKKIGFGDEISEVQVESPLCMGHSRDWFQ